MKSSNGIVAALILSTGMALAGNPPAAFTEEALARGLDFTMAPFPQAQGYLGQGGGFVDLDSDGDPDVVLIGAANGRIGIFENLGGGNFVDRSLTSGIPIMLQQEGFGAADYDADGLMDLYFTQHTERNVLMRNLGGFTFDDVTLTAIVADDGAGTGVSWGDFDNDGWLDLYVCNYSSFDPFNLNLLSHINEALGGHFDLSLFRHLAFFNEGENRIEMHLESLESQLVRIDALDVPLEAVTFLDRTY